MKRNGGVAVTASALEEVLAVFQKNGPVLKASELKLHGIGSRDLILLQKEGLIRKIRTGYYIWAADKERPDRLELVQMLIPEGVTCRLNSFILRTPATWRGYWNTRILTAR